MSENAHPACSLPVIKCGAEHSTYYRDALEPPSDSFLFNLPETLSPRLAWIQKHGIKTDWNDDANDWVAVLPPKGEEGKTVGELFADHGEYLPQAYGDTENEAIGGLAQLVGLKLWNEEGA